MKHNREGKSAETASNSNRPSAESQHAKEIQETWECWQRKPLLRAAYRDFHRLIRDQLAPGDGLTVELGSGIGMIKETIPECITTDIFPSPWVDRQEDAYNLSFPDNSIQNLILFDVWHHLEYPALALNEFNRVLTHSGRIIIFEPAAQSIFGRIIYSFLHHEPIGHFEDLNWQTATIDQERTQKYFAAQGSAWWCFKQGRIPPPLFRNWQIDYLSLLSAFDWLAAGGFRKKSLFPARLRFLLLCLNKMTQLIPIIFSTRMLIVCSQSCGSE